MRLKKIWLTIILICCSLLLFVSCEQESLAQSISLNGYSAENPLELQVGSFSYADYTVLITYDDGDTKELPLTEEMISETDKLKFYQEGEGEIVLSYQGVQTTVAIRVSRNIFADSVQLKDVTVTYTGKPFTIEVEGDIPGGAKILYPQGNTFQNAGSYDMTAILQADGYVTKTLSARVVIEKALYDVSNAQLYAETVVYNKDAYALPIKGKPVEREEDTIVHEAATLPQGVSVSYTITKIKDGMGIDIAAEKQQVVSGNKATDAGTYKVCAHFKGDASNYHLIPSSVAYLTIERAAYDMSKIVMLDKAVTYSGTEHSLSISSDSKVPFDVEVFYQIKRLKDGAGLDVKDTYKAGNKATDAGVYSVKASFQITGKNAGNYTTSPSEKTAYLTILRASFEEEVKKVYVDSQWYTLEDDRAFEIYLEGELLEGVYPQFVVTNERGEVVSGALEVITSTIAGTDKVKTTYKYTITVEEAGEYACKITFIHYNQNYEDITLELEAWIYIRDKA